MTRLSLVLALVLASGLGAQDLGRADRLWKAYLGDTVRRGWALGAQPGDSRPLWPGLDRARADARSLEPGPDVELIGAWMDRATGNGALALETLRSHWPRPATLRLPVRLWAETLFDTWEPGDGASWTAAWLAWEDKAYSPLGLVRGLEVLEAADPSVVGPLLNQARSLYPNDRRFLAVAARHPDLVPLAPALVTRDRAASGGWSRQTLTRLLRLGAGSSLGAYPDLEALGARDYGAWLSRASSDSTLEGAYDWDADGDGRAEHRLVFSDGQPLTWSRTGDSQWTLSFDQGRPSQMVERRGGASWTLRYEVYPVVASLEYRWGNHTLVYRFAPLEATIALWPEARLTAPPSRWPAALADLWMPLDPRGLALRSASIETWTGNVRTQTVFLTGGQVWMQVEDTNADGRDDVWSYFRAGTLASVYRDLEGRGGATLRELYRRGELAQVQSRLPGASRTEFALFPSDGVQLWDSQGRGRPLTRVFEWSGGPLQALVFSGSELPWSTMPTWEPRP